MKKLIFYSLFISCFIVVTILEADGQSSTDFKLQRKVALNPGSEKTEIKILSKNNLVHFNISINAIVYKGNLKIEILNPNGTKIDNFDIESHLPENEKSKSLAEWESNAVTGQIHKTFSNPTPGNWIVKIIPNSVLGEINIESISSYNSK